MRKYINTIIKAQNKTIEWESYSLEEAVIIIEKAYNIEIPKDVVESFLYTGLSNMDLLMSNFLPKHNIILK